MPRYELPGQQGRKGNYRRRLRRPTVGVVPALLLFYCISQGAGNKITHFNPSRYVPVPPVSQDTLHVLQCRKYSAAGSYAEFSSASNPSRHFPYIPPHGARTSFANHSIHRQQRRRTVPRFFLYSLTRRNARLSSKRTGTSPTVTRRRIPPRNIRNHSLYLSGMALCTEFDSSSGKKSAAEGLVKLARLCVAPRRDRSAVPDFTFYCNFSVENRVNNREETKDGCGLRQYYIGRGRSAGPPVLISEKTTERRRHNRAAEGAWRTACDYDDG